MRKHCGVIGRGVTIYAEDKNIVLEMRFPNGISTRTIKEKDEIDHIIEALRTARRHTFG
jgi:hypothetical protein